ncbi:MAG: hypothetical protein M1820_002703 [Bogoriella megaspora]|nr:MAG: hypothetical protein M1820_002703 [Bogoriella megaspora]
MFASNCFVFATLTLSAYAQSQSIISIPSESTYLLPDGFQGDYNFTFANGTKTSNDSLNSLLQAASQAPFISYDPEFSNILGANPTTQLVQQRADPFAHEAGVWVPERNEVWFTSFTIGSSTIYTFNLATNVIVPLNASETIVDPNGGYYFRGKVYFATYPNNETYRAAIISIDARTLQVETVLNSYFGLSFNGFNDLTWATQGNKSYMFFSDLTFADIFYADLPPSQLPLNIWRWDPQDKLLLPVVGRNEIAPNGIRVSPDQRTLYATDSGASARFGAGASSWYGPYIYAWDLNENMLPVNRRLFALARQGVADGLHIDDAGRVWSGEGEGVVVRNPQGKVLGIFNSQFFSEDKGVAGISFANFALAGDMLVVLSATRLWTVKLGQTVVSRNSPIVN